MHAGTRRKGKGRSRVLYWFRTPPGVRVGRAALDEDAIRLIEAYNPDVEFDWTRILKTQGVETRTPPPARERDYRAERLARRRERPAPPAAPPAPEPAPEEPRSGSDLDFADPEDRDLTPSPQSGSDLDIADPENRDLTPGPAAAERPTLARLGSEGLSRLRARYAEVLARISERIPDPARQEQLKADAERLNPDTWVTDAEVSEGLEAYETVFEGLRSAIGGPSRRRRRKRRRGGGQAGQPPHDPSSHEQTATPGGAGTSEDDQSEDL